MQKVSCEIAVGVDTPPNGESVLIGRRANTTNRHPRKQIWILEKYQEWQMDGSNETRFGKTPLVWQEASAKTISAFARINLPTRVVLDKKTPWKPFVYIQPSTRGMFFMNLEKHLENIEK